MLNAMHLANDPHPAPSPAHFRTVLGEYIRHAHAICGAPGALAKRFWLTSDEHKIICSWLRLLEQMLRRLVFVDALALAPDPAPAESKQRLRKSMPANAGAHFDPEASETWRVSFDLAAAAERRHRAGENTPRQHSARVDWRSLPNARASAPLALRLEALVRGFNGREQLAARCARLIARNRARALAYLASVRARDRVKPGFDQLVLLTELAGAHFQCFLAAACDTS